MDEDGFYRTTGLITYKRTQLDEDLVIDVSTVNKKSFGARVRHTILAKFPLCVIKGSKDPQFRPSHEEELNEKSLHRHT